jgi:hypothetical protein
VRLESRFRPFLSLESRKGKGAPLRCRRRVTAAEALSPLQPSPKGRPKATHFGEGSLAAFRERAASAILDDASMRDADKNPGKNS